VNFLVLIKVATIVQPCRRILNGRFGTVRPCGPSKKADFAHRRGGLKSRPKAASEEPFGTGLKIL